MTSFSSPPFSTPPFSSPRPPHSSHQDAAGAMDDHETWEQPGSLAGAVRGSLIGKLFLGEKDTTLEILEPVQLVGCSILFHQRVHWVHRRLCPYRVRVFRDFVGGVVRGIPGIESIRTPWTAALTC